MFRLVYTKLQKIYKYASKLYATLAVDKPLSLIAFYFILTLFLSIWVVQINLITDNESLTYVKNSDYLKNKKIVEREFPQEQKNRYLQNQLTDVGYYAEWIVKLKDRERVYSTGEIYSDFETNNFINETIFAEYNKFYDEILHLTVEDDFEKETKNSTSFVSYLDICPNRMGSPAIEGGIIRLESFQEKLLNRRASYQKNDPGLLIIEVAAQQGSSCNFVFGKLLKSECLRESCFITHIGQIRNRFDLLSITDEEKYISEKFLHKFVDHMENIQSDILEFSFHTSHTLETEIIKYSAIDVKYVYLTLSLFWLSFFVLMSIDVDFLSWKIVSRELKDFKTNSKCTQFFKFFCQFWLNGSAFMVMITFFQFVLTILSTLGLMSLLKIPINQLLYTIIFVLMINSCHQSLLLYKNFKRINFSRSKLERKYSFGYSKCPIECLSSKLPEADEERDNTKLLHVFTRLVHQVLVPNLFALLTTVLAYIVIGLTSAFDSISTYCLFMIVCLCFNFLGLLFFYCPCLIVHARKVAQNRSSILFCFYRSDTLEIQKNLSKFQDENINIDHVSPENEEITMNCQEANDVKRARNKNKLNSLVGNLSFYKFNLLYNTKFKYAVLVLFACYFVANAFICGFRVNIDIPISELLPADSYLAKHMTYHLRDFDLGPMIMLNFMKPFYASDSQKINKIIQFVDDVKSLDGVAQFEINLLRVFQQTQKTQSEFYPGNPFKVNYQSALQTKSNQYIDDLFYRIVNVTSDNSTEQEVEFEKVRLYVQIAKLVGSTKELNIMHDIQHMADTQFEKGELIVFSSVYVYLEQLGEIFPSVLTLVTIMMESVFFGSLFLFFDLRSVCIQLLVFVSLTLAIFSNLYVFGISLNIATLYQMIMLPALLTEFLFYTIHLFLYKMPVDCEPKQNPSSRPFVYKGSKLDYINSSSTSSLNLKTQTTTDETNDSTSKGGDQVKKTTTKRVVFKRLQFVLNKNINLTSLYLLFISLFGFSFMSQCTTYNFHTLCLFLMIICINSFFHIHYLYPNLLNMFGARWQSKQKNNLALKETVAPTTENVDETPGV